MPELNTSSLPDLIFSVLFFFMMVTSMREETMKVTIQKPAGTQLEKLARKSCTSFIYIGKPNDPSAGTATRIQLNDRYAEPAEVSEFVKIERGELSEQDQPLFTVSMKIDEGSHMGIVTSVKQVLRNAYALKIMYSANKKQQ